MSNITSDWSPAKRRLVRDVLRKALKLISDKKRWAQGTMAINAEGHCVSPKSRDAVAFCALGALELVGGGAYYDAARALDDVGGLDIMSLNDGRAGHSRVLARFRKAIAALSARCAK